MSETQVDLVVIGAGPGGEALASGAARAGLEVVVVDKDLVGGECPYYGCIPTKMMVRASNALTEARRVGELAGAATVTASWRPVARRIAGEATDGWDDAVAVSRLRDLGVVVHHGTGRLAGPGRVSVQTASERLTYSVRRGIVVNPGGRPAVPQIVGLADVPYWTSRDVVRLTELPTSLVVLGGGPIGCEIAQVMARYGVDVTIVQRNQRLLPGDEPEASAVVAKVFADDGVRVLTGARVTRAAMTGGRVGLSVDSGEELRADGVLVATGRRSNLDELGLETVGLDPDAQVLDVDDRLRVRSAETGGTGLWAIGDVTGYGSYTHVSMYQQAVALRDVLGQDGPAATFRAVPHVTFTDPEVGAVGLTESAAVSAGFDVRTGLADISQSSRAFTHGPGAAGVIKIVEDADRGVLVGATVAGPSGGEVLGLLALAVHAAVPVETLRAMMYAYPTFHRAVETALADLG